MQHFAEYKLIICQMWRYICRPLQNCCCGLWRILDVRCGVVFLGALQFVT